MLSSLVNFFILSDFYIQVYLTSHYNLYNLFKFFKFSSLFNLDMLVDIKCDDICFFSKNYRFKITYVFLSLAYNIRFFVILFVKEGQSLPSIGKLYKSSGFLERQLWDLFGINFNFVNKSLHRRILTDYGLKFKPLRKEIPQSGFIECFYDHEKGRMRTRPLVLLQEYRKFSFKSYII